MAAAILTCTTPGLSKNYALSEHFIAEGTGDAPAMWDVTGDWKLTKTESERGYDLVSVKSETKAGETSTASPFVHTDCRQDQL